MRWRMVALAYGSRRVHGDDISRGKNKNANVEFEVSGLILKSIVEDS